MARRFRGKQIAEMEGSAEGIAAMYFDMIGDPDSWTGESGDSLIGSLYEVLDSASGRARNQLEWLVLIAFNGLALVVLDDWSDIPGTLESLAHLNDPKLTAGYLDLLWAYRVDDKPIDDDRYRSFVASWIDDIELVFDQLDKSRQSQWCGLKD